MTSWSQLGSSPTSGRALLGLPASPNLHLPQHCPQDESHIPSFQRQGLSLRRLDASHLPSEPSMEGAVHWALWGGGCSQAYGRVPRILPNTIPGWGQPAEAARKGWAGICSEGGTHPCLEFRMKHMPAQRPSSSKAGISYFILCT